ncbi:hypothetical protein Tsubulata_033980 [Turnera subulata]|uniref:Peptidase A1 domain-containing protein n=1 Tax=Turnera subulata TaxID=218843 RepID=A0A9Q0FHC2_9ROSI|nr:hypothetical protein Tsubulata_033980 [Turnera subulata]
MASNRLLACYLISFAFCISLASPPKSSNPKNASSPSTIPYAAVTKFPLHHISKLMGSKYNEFEFLTSTLMATNEQYASNPSVLDGKLERRPKYFGTPFLLRPGGEYLVEVRIGSEDTRAHLVLDTGSNLIWWQCKPCEECFGQQDELYDPSLTTSNQEIDCISPWCKTKKEGLSNVCVTGARGEPNKCGYSQRYADTSTTKGILCRDYVSMVDFSYQWRNIVMGCAHTNRNFYAMEFFSGTLGFGSGNFSFPSQVNATRYCFCLTGDSGRGDNFLYLQKLPTPINEYGSLVVPIFQNQIAFNLHYVQFTGISFDGKMIPINPIRWRINPQGKYGVIVDSGSAVSWFTPGIYGMIRNKFREALPDHKPVKPNFRTDFDTCYRVTENFYRDVPKINFYFAPRTKPFRLDYEQLVMTHKGENVACLAFLPRNHSLEITTIGTYQLRGTRLDFDLSKKTLTLYPHEC